MACATCASVSSKWSDAPRWCNAGRSPFGRTFRMVAEVGTPGSRCISAVSAPCFCKAAMTKSAFSSSPTAPTARVRKPSLAQSMAVPPAVPATVRRISSMNSTLPPAGIACTGRPSTSRM